MLPLAYPDRRSGQVVFREAQLLQHVMQKPGTDFLPGVFDRGQPIVEQQLAVATLIGILDPAVPHEAFQEADELGPLTRGRIAHWCAIGKMGCRWRRT